VDVAVTAAAGQPVSGLGQSPRWVSSSPETPGHMFGTPALTPAPPWSPDPGYLDQILAVGVGKYVDIIGHHKVRDDPRMLNPAGQALGCLCGWLAGSASQSGSRPTPPPVQIGGQTATVHQA
jgi:hypothetical protein